MSTFKNLLQRRLRTMTDAVAKTLIEKGLITEDELRAKLLHEAGELLGRVETNALVVRYDALPEEARHGGYALW